MVPMRPPEGGTSLSFNGELYEADENGIVRLPDEAVGDALSHGFTVASEEDEEIVNPFVDNASKKGRKSNV